MKILKGTLFGCLVLAFIFLNGCAVGNRYNLSDARPDIQVTSPKIKNVAVAASDQRKVVLSGECDPSYVGMQRGGFGNPFRVSTESGLPLADELTKSVSESLSQKGYNSVPVYIKYGKDPGLIAPLLKESKADRYLLFVIKKWESDTYQNIGLEYEIELTVYDSDMQKKASVSVAEHKDIPGSAWNPPAAAKEQVPIAFKNVLEKLLNYPAILAAIQ